MPGDVANGADAVPCPRGTDYSYGFGQIHTPQAN